MDIYKTTFRPMKATLSGRNTRTFMKLVVDGESDRVLGCHIIGPDAGELVQVLGIAVKMRATKADFDATMAVHPTAAEELVTMRERAARRTRGGGGIVRNINRSRASRLAKRGRLVYKPLHDAARNLWRFRSN